MLAVRDDGAACGFGFGLDFGFGCAFSFDFLLLDDSDDVKARGVEDELEEVDAAEVVVDAGLGGCGRPSRMMTRRRFESADW